jgi:hypothetical protein
LRIELGYRIGVLLAADPGDDIPAAGGKVFDDSFADPT